MQQTEKYQLNLIEGGDKFLPEPLNENAEKLETALVQNKESLEAALVQNKESLEAALSQNSQSLEAALEALAQTIPRIETGSYVGTGTYGIGNPCTLTFGFQPKFVLVQKENSFSGSAYSNMVCFYPWPSSQTAASGSPTMDLTWGENSLSWCGTGGVNYQLNVAGARYWYIAIG